MRQVYLGVDFGASNGRVIAGYFTPTEGGKQLIMEEVYRFSNHPVRVGGYLYWDFPALFSEMKTGLSKAALKYSDIVSIGIDTWGVDFGLIDRNGNLVSNPICYRDPHSLGKVEEFASTHDVVEHYAETGIQMLAINTLYRLMSMADSHDPRLEIADKLLFMPDLFSYYLTGETGNEYTISSTSELLEARNREWNTRLILSLGINPALFGEIIMPGTNRGHLLKEVCDETGLSCDVKVLAVGSHDTASAVFAVAEDYEESGAAFLSSGTWSLIGVLVKYPILTEEARLGGFTNEGAVGGKTRLLTNITGLWILQQIVAQWKAAGETCDWETLIKEAEETAEVTLIDVDDPMFQNPDDMIGNLRKYCMVNNLKFPDTRGKIVRSVCASLAARYKKAIESLNKMLPTPVKKLIVFGGGARNRLLNKLTAEATGLEIVVKEAEATAMGNILMQSIANGEIKDKNEVTKIVFQ